MTQEEIIQAITETIVPNGQKGITAESLANLLISMVESSSGGDGALRVFASTDAPQSPADLEGMDAEYQDYYEAFSALFAHNANVYAQIVAARDSGKPCPSVVIDEGVILSLTYKFIYENNPEDMPFQVVGAASYPADVTSVKDAGGSGILGEQDRLVIITPTGSAKEIIPSLTLAEDGGYTIGVNLNMVKVYIPSDEVALTDSDKEHNISIYGVCGEHDILGKEIQIYRSDDLLYHGSAILARKMTYNSSGSIWNLLFLGDDLKIHKCSITFEGDASVSVYAVLTAPTT